MSESGRSLTRRLQDLDDRVLGPQGKPPGWSYPRFLLSSALLWPRWFYPFPFALLVVLRLLPRELEWFPGVMVIVFIMVVMVATWIAVRQRRVAWHRDARQAREGG
jgi:hypothetical protein